MEHFAVRGVGSVEEEYVLIGSAEAWGEIEKAAQANKNHNCMVWIDMYLKPYAIMGRDRLDTGGRKGRGALLTTLLSGGTFTQCLRKTKVFILAGVGKRDLVNDVAPAFVSFTSLGVTVSNPDDFCAWVTTYQPSWLEKPRSTISSSSSNSPHPGGFSAVTPPPVSSPVPPLNDAFLPSSDPAENERDRSADQGLGNSIPIPNRILDKLDPLLSLPSPNRWPPRRRRASAYHSEPRCGGGRWRWRERLNPGYGLGRFQRVEERLTQPVLFRGCRTD